MYPKINILSAAAYQSTIIHCEHSYIDGIVQEGRSSIANALGLSLSCTNPSMYGYSPSMQTL